MKVTVDPAWKGEVRPDTPAQVIRSMAIVRPDGRKLRQLREKAGLSVRDLSRQTGLSETTVRKAERPRRWEGVEVGTLQLLAKALGVDWKKLPLGC